MKVDLFRKVFILILIIFPVSAMPGYAQDSQEAFEIELIAACLENNISQIKTHIDTHRLWVKPVVDHLIGAYIEYKLAGRESEAKSRQEAANLIAKTFQETYGENSLVFGTGYLDGWDNKSLEKKAKADNLYVHATDLRKSGQQTELAIKTFQDALAFYTEIGDVRGQGEVLGGLGYIYYFIDADTCLIYYQMALIAREKADDKYLVGGTLNTLGLVYYNFFYDLEKSIEYLNRATLVRQEIGDWAGLGGTLSMLGEVYRYNGEPEIAIQSFEKSFIINQKAGNRSRMAEAKLHSGTLLRVTGKYPEALNNLEMALGTFSELGDIVHTGDVYTQIAMVYENLGDYDKAITSATKASQLFEKANDLWGLAGAYNHIAIILHDVKRYSKALDYYKKSLEIYKELDDQQNMVNVLTNLGTLSFDFNDFNGAEIYHQQGLQISRKLEYNSGELSCLLNLANTQNRLGKLDEALTNYDSGLNLSRSMNNPEIEWKNLVGIAENYKLRGDYLKAIEYNEAGLNMIEELRTTLQSEEYRSSYMARERFAFEDVIHMLATLHDTDISKGYDLLAFEYAQRCKSRSFLDFLAGSSDTIPGKKIHSPHPATLNEIQSSLPDKNTVLLEYSIGDSSSYLWVITEDHHQLISIPNHNILKELIETLRFASLNPHQNNKDFFTQSSYSLYKHLIQPAEHHFSKKNHLVILPDGMLNYLPFEVLITKEQIQSTNQSYKDLSFLVKEFPISYCNSSSVLKNLLEQSRANGQGYKTGHNLIAFGDPVYNEFPDSSSETRKGFNRLEHSGNEVKQIASLFQGGSAELFLRENASEENVKKEGALSPFRYLHFATHGLMDEKNPENSSLVLTLGNDSPEDGFLKASEIYNLEMNADLVVLSACQSGLGKMVRGEGIIGLTRAFMYAGTPSVLASLWSVSDASTTLLMQRFYENLITEKLSKTDALNKAQISMIKDEQYSHPFFWAPFVLNGDWK